MPRDAKGRFCKARKFKVGDAVSGKGWLTGSYYEGNVVHCGETSVFILTADGLKPTLSLETVMLRPTKLKKGDHFTIEGVEGTQVVLGEYKSRKPRKPATKPEPSRTYPSVVTNLDAECGIGSMYFGPAGLKIKTHGGWEDATHPEPTIAPGSVVRLKSGGPEMTVNVTSACGLDGMASVSYFHNGKIVDALAHVHSLEVVR